MSADSPPQREPTRTTSWLDKAQEGQPVAFFSASQDVVIDAYRVELLTLAEQGAVPDEGQEVGDDDGGDDAGPVEWFHAVRIRPIWRPAQGGAFA